jgi:hypothetical protein
MPARTVCKDDCPGIEDYEPHDDGARPELAALAQLLDEDEGEN